jgi:hypothetical protein
VLGHWNAVSPVSARSAGTGRRPHGGPVREDHLVEDHFPHVDRAGLISDAVRSNLNHCILIAGSHRPLPDCYLGGNMDRGESG